MAIAHIIEPGQLPARWEPLLTLGIVLIGFGTLALVVSFVATLATSLVFGWLLLVTGGVEMAYAFKDARWVGTILHVANGALSVVAAGFLLLMSPAAGAVVLTLLIAMFFLIGGLFRLVAAMVVPPPHRGWILLSGAVTLLAAMAARTRR